MKKKVIKTAFAAVCVVGAGMGALKAYNVADQSKVDMLLAQNVDALSWDYEYELEYIEAKDQAELEIKPMCPYQVDNVTCEKDIVIRNSAGLEFEFKGLKYYHHSDAPAQQSSSEEDNDDSNNSSSSQSQTKTKNTKDNNKDSKRGR